MIKWNHIFLHMLYKTEYGEERIQGAFVDDDEINAVVSFLAENNEQVYLIDDESLNQKVIEIEEADDNDDMFEEVAYFCVRNKTASTNQIQKTFNMSGIKSLCAFPTATLIPASLNISISLCPSPIAITYFGSRW